MSKNQKYSSTLSIKADADFSSLISSIEKVQNSMKAKMSGKDALGIEESLNKIKQLQEKLNIMRDRGFSSPKEINEYSRLMDQLINQATDVQSAFKRIHLTGLDKEVNKFDSELKQARRETANLENDFLKIAKEAAKGVDAIKSFEAELKETLETSTTLKQVQDKTTQSIKEQVQKQKELVKVKQQEVDKYNFKTQVPRVSSQSFSIKDNYSGDKSNAEVMRKVASAYNAALKSTAKDAESMYKVFENQLSGKGLELKSKSTAINKFREAFVNAFKDGDNAAKQAIVDLQDTENRLNSLEETSKNISKFFNQASVKKLFEQYQAGKISIEELTQSLKVAKEEAKNRELPESIQETGQELDNAAKKSLELQTSLNDVSNQQVQFDSLTDSVGNFVKRILSVTTAYQTLRRVVISTFSDIKNLDKAFGEIAMVTNYSVSEMWQQYGTYAEMANRLGQTTQSVIEASGLYYQQGLKTAEVMKLTEDTMKLATLAGLDFKEATSQMTGALRAFHMEMDQGAHVTDVYASIAANAAVDVNGISEAMSATAAIAHSAGMSFENTSAMLATMVEATQEAPKNLGTAMKAIIARFTELKTNVAGTADSEFDDLDYNKVDKALKSVGISIKDAAGQFRNLDEVFLELSAKWNTLERNTQRYIATIAAGSRQQSRFIALMENYERTMELIQVADESSGKADQQFAKYSDTITYKLNRLKNAWEQTKTTIFTSEFYGDLLDIITKLVEKLEGLDWKKLLIAAPIAIAAGREMGKNWALGFKSGAALLKDQFSKLPNKKGLTTEELKTNYVSSKTKYSETTGLEQTKLLRNMRPEIAVEGKIKKELDGQLEVLNEISKKRAEINKQIENDNFLSEAERNEALKQKEEIEAQYSNAWKQYDDIAKGDTDDIKKFSQEANKSFEQVKQNRADLWKSQTWSALGSAAGMAAGTALTMGLMGTFNAKEIFTTIGIESGITALTQALSGNIAGAAISAGIGVASVAIAGISSWVEKRAEKIREESSVAYKYQKIQEQLAEKEEELNKNLSKSSKAFEEKSESFKALEDAVQTYDELADKTIKTTEEQEKLNDAVAVLSQYNSDLIVGYDQQGQAIIKIGENWDDVIDKEREAYNLLLKNKLGDEVKKLANDYGEKEAQLNELEGYETDLKNYKPAWKSFAYTPEGSAFGTLWTGGLSAWVSEKFGYVGDFALDPLQELIQLEDYNEGWFQDKGDSLLNRIKEDFPQLESVLLKAAQVAGVDAKAFEDLYDVLEDSTAFNKFKKTLTSWVEDPNAIGNSLRKEIETAKLELESYKSQYQDLAQAYAETFLSNNKFYNKLKTRDKNQLSLVLRKSLFGDIEELYKQIKDGNLDKFVQEKISNSSLVNEFLNLSDETKDKFAEMLSNLLNLSPAEIEEKLKELNLSGELKNYITGQIEELENETDTNIKEKIWSLLFPDKTYSRSVFNNTEIGRIMSEMGYNAKQNFMNSFADVDKNAQSKFIQNLNNFLTTELSNIDRDVLINLMSGDWSGDIMSLANSERSFVKYAKTVGIETEEAQTIWQKYKKYMETQGVIDFTKITDPSAISASIESILKERMSSMSGVTGAIQTALTNGFLNFSESQEFKEACEKIGLDASEYLYNSDKGYGLNIIGLENDLRNATEQEEKLLEDIITAKEKEAEAEIEILENKRTSLQITLAELKANQAILEAQGKKSLSLDKAITDLSIDDAAIGQKIDKLRNNLNETLNDIRQSFDESKGLFASYNKQIGNTLDKIWEDYEKQGEKIRLDVEEAQNALNKAKEDEAKAQQKYHESLYGSKNYKSNLDPLNNYEAVLDNITYKAKQAKEALEDLEPEDNVKNLLNTYANQVHNEAVTRTAENEVIKKAMANTEKQLAQYSQYWQKFGDTYILNVDKIAKAQIPDDLKNEIESQVEQLRKWQKNLRDNESALDQLRKEFKESRKKALQSYVDLEKEVVEALKEQYQKEIDDLKNKYDAMSTADEDYLNSLEAAIEKERRLRQRQNEWDDLATKEKKLSLMQRDTSGANQLEVQKLQQEVEKDRTQLLDNTVDDIVNSLKEMYDLQKESREAELEYMNSMLDNVELIKQANEIIGSWQSSADAVNWFMQAKDLNAMSTAELELEKESWEKLYKAKELYEEQSNLKFDDYLKATQEEINNQLKTISETATTYTKTSMDIVKENILESQKAALRSYKDAQAATEQAEKNLEAAKAIAAEYNNMLPIVQQIAESLLPILGAVSNILFTPLDSMGAALSIPTVPAGAGIPIDYNIGSEQARYQKEQGQDKQKGIILTQDKIIEAIDRDFASLLSKGYGSSSDSRLYEAYKMYGPQRLADTIREYFGLDYNNNYLEIRVNDSTHEIDVINTNAKNNSLIPFDNKKKKVGVYATGGLVDYTGPAWVDGSPSRPEAFLSVDDTRLIGNLVNLLSDLPALNPNTTPSSISTSNIGDTTINLTVNFDSVSEDYDVERVVDIMKEKIVEAANYTGANVILNKR